MEIDIHSFDSSFLLEDFRKVDISLSENQINQFILFYNVLVEKNKVMNLTAITEWKDIVVKHFLDSALIVKTVCLEEFSNLIDVGTGAGFPGIVLKILYPDLEITLADSLNKRLNFLNEVIEILSLKGIRTVHARAEELGRDPAYREKYQIAVSRAVASLPTLCEYCMPLVKIGGVFVSYKSDKAEDEIQSSKKAIKVLGGMMEKSKMIPLPGDDITRCFVVIRKDSATGKKYPRKAPLPSKDPIV
jgi:16S rRNA (guanine527-N7)-methyltransferase